MRDTSTITSKNQITLPAQIVRKAGLKQGHKLSVTLENGRIVLTPDEQIINKLSGILKGKGLPKWDGMSADEIIADAKRRYFKRYGKL